MVDLGTGTGNLLKDLSAAAGSNGHVIAEDIFPDFLDRARNRAKTTGLGNVEFVLGTETDPNCRPVERTWCLFSTRIITLITRRKC